jgi:hypothetical protein
VRHAYSTVTVSKLQIPLNAYAQMAPVVKDVMSTWVIVTENRVLMEHAFLQEAHPVTSALVSLGLLEQTVNII